MGLKAFFFNSIWRRLFVRKCLFCITLCFGIYFNVPVCINTVCLCLVLCCNVLHITKPLLKPHIFRCDDCVSFLKQQSGCNESSSTALNSSPGSTVLRLNSSAKSRFLLSKSKVYFQGYELERIVLPQVHGKRGRQVFLSIISVSDTPAVMEKGSIFVACGRLRALDGYSTEQDAQ